MALLKRSVWWISQFTCTYAGVRLCSNMEKMSQCSLFSSFLSSPFLSSPLFLSVSFFNLSFIVLIFNTFSISSSYEEKADLSSFWMILDVKPEVSLFIAFLVFHLFFCLPLEKLNSKSDCFFTVSVYPCLVSCSLWIVFNHLALTLSPFRRAVEPHGACWDLLGLAYSPFSRKIVITWCFRKFLFYE